MANEIFTRIQLKYDSYTSWKTNNPTLLAGEVAIAKLVNDVTIPEDANTNAPVLFKVGPGTFNNLPWVSGLAADVYAWAKKPTPDWKDFPALPIEVVDTETGKFVTDFEYADNKLTIHRSDVYWNDIQNKPDLVNSVKVTDDDVVIGTPVDATSGDVTIDIKHKAYNKAGSTSDTSSDATTAGASVTIKVPTLTVDAYGHTEFNGETSHTITIPSEVAVGDGNITIAAGDGLAEGGSFNVNQDGDATITLKHGDTSSVENVAAADRTYVKSLTFDEFGHVTAVDVGTETVEDTNTAHTHEVGDGLKQTGDGGINGKVKTELNLAFELKDGNIILKDNANGNAVATLDAAELLEDSYLDDVKIEGNNLEFTWKMDDGSTKTDSVDLTHLVDVYKGEATDTITVTVKDYKISAVINEDSIETEHLKDEAVTRSKIAAKAVSADEIDDKAITEDKLAEAVTTKLNKQWQPVGNYQPAGDYKTKQTAVADPKVDPLGPGATLEFISTISQDENGVIFATKQTVDTYSQKEITDKVGEVRELVDALYNGDGTAESANYAAEAGKATNDGNGEEIASTYARKDSLATIATSGSIYDVVEGSHVSQGTDTNVKYLIFNCGTASTVI